MPFNRSTWDDLQSVFQSLSENDLKKIGIHVGAAEKAQQGKIKIAEMDAKTLAERNQQANRQLDGGSAPMGAPWQGMASSPTPQDVLNMNRQFRA